MELRNECLSSENASEIDLMQSTKKIDSLIFGKTQNI